MCKSGVIVAPQLPTIIRSRGKIMLSVALESLDLWPLNDACNVSSGVCSCVLGGVGVCDGDITSHINSEGILGPMCGFSRPFPSLHASLIAEWDFWLCSSISDWNFSRLGQQFPFIFFCSLMLVQNTEFPLQHQKCLAVVKWLAGNSHCDWTSDNFEHFAPSPSRFY